MINRLLYVILPSIIVLILSISCLGAGWKTQDLFLLICSPLFALELGLIIGLALNKKEII